MGTDPCPNATCKKKRGLAQKVTVATVSPPTANCPAVTVADALAAIQADVLDEYSFPEYEVVGCVKENCICGAKDWPVPVWQTDTFDWELDKEIPKTPDKPARTCTYQITGTVETCVQLIEGPCRAHKLKKGKTPKKKGKAGKVEAHVSR
jgi:hypothetical protein